MQITSKKGSIVLDYYPIKNLNSNIYPNEFLRVLSFKGETMRKSIVTDAIMQEEVEDRVTNFPYLVTDNHVNRPQFVSHFQRRDLTWII